MECTCDMCTCMCVQVHVCISLRYCVLVRVSIAVKRHHDHSSSCKEKHFTEVAVYSSEVQPIMILTANMAAHRLTWCWLHLDQKATGNGL